MTKTQLSVISFCVLILPVVALVPVIVSADIGGTTGGTNGITGMEGTAPGGLLTEAPTFQEVIHLIENAVGLIFGAIAVVSFVLAGILFLTANGDPEKIGTARSAVIWGVVGIAVGLIAFVIVSIVANLLGTATT
jgi:hypothetical protein